MKPVIRPATRADIEQFYGQSFHKTVRAWAAELDGQTIGLAGLVYHVGRPWYLFSAHKPEMLRFKKTMVAAGKMVLKELEGIPGQALTDNPKSAKLLEHLGLVYVCHTPDGALYQWEGRPWQR